MSEHQCELCSRLARTEWEKKRRAIVKGLLVAYRVGLRCGCNPAASEWAKYQFQFTGTHIPACQEAEKNLKVLSA